MRRPSIVALDFELAARALIRRRRARRRGRRLARQQVREYRRADYYREKGRR